MSICHLGSGKLKTIPQVPLGISGNMIINMQGAIQKIKIRVSQVPRGIPKGGFYSERADAFVISPNR